MSARGPAYLEFFVARGEDVTFPMVHQRAADDPTPVDLTGRAVRFKVMTKAGTVIAERAATLGCVLEDGTVVTAAQGGYSWNLLHAETDVVPALAGVDIWVTDNGAQRAMVIGTLKIANDIRYGTWVK